MAVTTIPLSSIEKEAKNGRVCSKCVHVNVCSIYRAIAPLINNSFKSHKPFEPEDLAKICKEFMPVIATNVLRKRE